MRYFLHLDYGDVLDDQAFNNSFKEKLKSIQYDVCLALTGAIWDTSKDLSNLTRIGTRVP